MAEGTGTITNWDTSSTKRLVENVGSFSPNYMFKYVPSSADDTAGTIDLTFPSISTIVGWFVEVYESGTKDANQDPVVTSSGNVLTIADGSNYTLATTSELYIVVFGKPLA
jgi:hypothetical protein